MTDTDTSRESASATKEQRRTQRERLHAILRAAPAGFTDAEIAEIMELPRALASARRNDLDTWLEGTGAHERVRSVGTRIDQYTRRKVKVWKLVYDKPEPAPGVQGELFGTGPARDVRDPVHNGGV